MCLPSGETTGCVVGAAAVGERVNGIVRQIHAVDLGVEGLVIRIRAPIGADQHALAVGGERGRARIVEIAVRELAHRTAVGADDE